MPRLPDAIVLCGGAGTRLRCITGDGPKSMVRIGGRPFLELLLRQLRRHGFERVILAVSYGADVIRAHFGEEAHGLSVAYSVETTPLGTGGALRNAVDVIKSDEVLVMNGDSYTDADLTEFVAAHRRFEDDASMVVIPTDGRDDSGAIAVDESGRVVRFMEKESSADARYNNAGVYLIPRSMLGELTVDKTLSVERDVFPRWIARGKHIGAFVYSGPCLDIGTPERFQSAQDLLANAEASTPVTSRESQS